MFLLAGGSPVPPGCGFFDLNKKAMVVFGSLRLVLILLEIYS
jgi:hypothetical protein